MTRFTDRFLISVITNTSAVDGLFSGNQSRKDRAWVTVSKEKGL